MSQNSVTKGPLVYNLFPRLVGDMHTWDAHARRARRMGFDWLYLNPIHFPGFSGSCYAVKDFDRIDPLLLPEGHPDKHYDDSLRGDGGLKALADALEAIRSTGMHPMLDLVLNHTSRDALLVEQHPEWYARDAQGEILSPSAIDPADARKVTVWGDLAELDHAHSPAREGLWSYWRQRIERYVEMGFEGFRCDAAYKVPAELWAQLVAAARRVNPNVLFLAETLGARLEEIDALRHSGMQFIFNSSRYWAFDQPWCLDQQRQQAAFVRSIAFPESHDTPRLWAETNGHVAVQKQRYAFAAAFSSGVLMPVGYEFGFRRSLHVVETRPNHWESPNIDLSDFIRRVNEACKAIPAFCSDSVEAVTPLDAAVLLLERRWGDQAAFLAINKDWHASQALGLPEAARRRRLLRVCRDEADADEVCERVLDLQPAEVAYLV